MINAKPNILVVGEKMNYLFSSVVDKLNDAGLDATICNTEMERFSRELKSCITVLVYCDEVVISNQPFIIYLKDVMLETDIPVFAIGGEDELFELHKVIPEHMLQGVFKRPLNVKDVAEKISNFVNSIKTQEKKKILVVDDSSVMLHSIKGWLSGKYHVTLADSGVSAIKCLSLNRPDLILLDYEMPIVDGRQVLAMIRSETEFIDVPVVFLTGKSDRQSVVEVMDLKPNGYLLKSMTPMEIVKYIDDFFIKQKTNI